ncbi:peroxiredoxin family protein [bacterium]|nr:peroxiredoxin family protein [bacterium]
MVEIKQNHATIEQHQTTIFALSADTTKQSIALSQELGLPFQLLCDTDKKVMSRYHLLNQNEHGGIAYPAIFLIKPSGIIGYRSLDRTAQRVNLSEILGYVKDLSQHPEYTLESSSKKEKIVPTLKTLKQIGRNMFLRGNRTDWKHYLGFPFLVIFNFLVKKAGKKKTSHIK